MADQPLILVVDDDPNFREIFQHTLSGAGFRVETAESGDEALRKAADIKPALVLMDMVMPGMDGATALLKFQEGPATKDIKVAFLTSMGDPMEMTEGDENAAKGFGAAGYFKKTDDLQVLARKVREIVDQGTPAGA